MGADTVRGARRPRLLSIVLAVAAAGAAARAPARAVEPLRLSLDDAVARALASGTAARRADALVADARGSARVARSGLIPQVSGDVARMNQQLDLAVLGFPAPERIIGPFDSVTFDLSAQAALLDLSKIRAYRASKAGLAANEADRRVTRADVAAAAARLYIGLEKAQALVRQAKANVDLFSAVAKTAAHQREAGTATRLDTARASIQLNEQRQALAAARLDRERARVALLEAMGEDDLGTEVEPTDSLEPDDRPVPDIGAALAQARSDRPEFERLDAERQRRALDVAAAAASRYPVLRAQALVSDGGNSLHNLEVIRSFGVTLGIPIFTGGRIRGAMERARAAESSAAIDDEATRRRVERQVRDAVAAVAAARERVDLARQNADLADDDLASARHRFEAGVSTSIELDNSQTAYAASRERLVAARADLATAWTDYDLAVGATARKADALTAGGS